MNSAFAAVYNVRVFFHCNNSVIFKRADVMVADALSEIEYRSDSDAIARYLYDIRL